MTASHEERETYDPRSLQAPIPRQGDAGTSRPVSEVHATGTASAQWHPARGAGPDDWLDASHAYATLSSAARAGSPTDAGDVAVSGTGAEHMTRTVTSDAANVTTSLLEEVTKRVMSTDYIDASQVHIAVQDMRVTLTGLASDERSKAQIEQLVAGCDGVKGIDNQLRVGRAAGDR